MSITLRLILSYFFLILASSLFAIIQLSGNVGIRAQTLPYVIIETPGNARGLAEFLEEEEIGQVLWRESVLIPVSRFGLLEFQNLASLASRQAQQDIRLLPQLSRLMDEFRTSNNGGELLYVFGPSGHSELEAILSNYEGEFFIHFARNLPRFSGVILWLLVLIMFLVFFDGFRWTIISMIAFLPGYLLQSPFHIGVSVILCICSRDIIAKLLSGFGQSVNENTDIHVPEDPKNSILFIGRQIRLHAEGAEVWFYLWSLVLAVHALATGEIAGLYFIATSTILGIVLFVEMHSTAQRIRERDHLLFFASHIMPTWSMPQRRERAAILMLIVLIVSLPFLFRSTVSPFPTLALEEDVLGYLDVEDDITELRTKIVDLLNHRVYELDSRSAAEGSAGAFAEGSAGVSIVDILLADRAYQQIFPYLSLSSYEGASRYENGGVHLTRYEESNGTLRAYEERVFELTNEWIVAEFTTRSRLDMLRLYINKNKWYDVRVSSSVRISSRSRNAVLEALLLLVALLPWIGRWRFAPIQKFMKKLRGT